MAYGQPVGIPNTLALGPSGEPLGQHGPRLKGVAAVPAQIQQASGAPAVGAGKTPLMAIGVAIAILVVVRFALEYLDRRGGVDASRIVTPSVWNFIIVTLLVTLGLAIEKVVFNQVYVPGWTEVSNAA